MTLLKLTTSQDKPDLWQREFYACDQDFIFDGIDIRPYAILRPGDKISVTVTIERKNDGPVQQVS